MPYMIQRPVLLIVALAALIAMPFTVAAQERDNFWVVGSTHELDRARDIEKHIETGTGMQVFIVTSHARGDFQYLLLVEASHNKDNRELQKMNLDYFGVRDPWLITMDVPLKTVEAPADEQTPPRTELPEEELVELGVPASTPAEEEAAATTASTEPEMMPAEEEAVAAAESTEPEAMPTEEEAVATTEESAEPEAMPVAEEPVAAAESAEPEAMPAEEEPVATTEESTEPEAMPAEEEPVATTEESTEPEAMPAEEEPVATTKESTEPEPMPAKEEAVAAAESAEPEAMPLEEEPVAAAESTEPEAMPAEEEPVATTEESTEPEAMPAEEEAVAAAESAEPEAMPAEEEPVATTEESTEPEAMPAAPVSRRMTSADVNALVAAGLASVRHKQFQDAVDRFSEAIAAATDNELLYFYRANSHMRLKEYDRAFRDYNRATELNPSFSDAFSGRGLAQQRLGDQEAALRDYKHALELDPDNAHAIIYRARLFAIQILPVLVILLI